MYVVYPNWGVFSSFLKTPKLANTSKLKSVLFAWVISNGPKFGVNTLCDLPVAGVPVVAIS